MTPTQTPPGTSAPASAAPLRWGPAVALHLVPGLALVAVFSVAAPLLQRNGLPAVWGLLLPMLLVLVPIELGLVVRSLRSRGLPLRPASLGLQPLRRADLRPLLLTFTVAALAPGAVLWLEPVLRVAAFGWLPDWWRADPGGLSSASPLVAGATVVLWLVVAVLVGPLAEEVYFRGWLLPRLPAGRTVAALASTALFAVYHLWQPQAVLTVFVFALPLTVLVQRRGVTASWVVHAGANLLALGALLAGAVAR